MKTPSEKILWQLFELMFRTKAHVARIAEEFGLTPMQLQVLRILSPGQPEPMSTLSETLVCDASNVTGLIDRLESRGLVQRCQDPDDRRIKQLVITEEGQQVRDKAIRQLAAQATEIRSLSDADRAALLRLLEKALKR